MIVAVDKFAPFNAAEVAVIRKQGATHVARYLGVKTRGWTKGMTLDEVKLLSANHVSIVSIWEGNPTHVSYFTYAQGLIDGKDAATDAEALGQPHGSAIYFAIDCDVQDRDMNAVRMYLNGVRKGLNKRYKLGVYGSYRVMANVAADYYWQTSAWSYGKVDTKRVNLYQRVEDTTVGGIAVDIDDVVTPDVGAWPVQPKTTVVHRKPVSTQPVTTQPSAPTPVAPAHPLPTPNPGDGSIVVQSKTEWYDPYGFIVDLKFTGPKETTTLPLIVDTGAIELMVTSTFAEMLGLPNLGTANVMGVGGAIKAYQSKVTLDIAGHTFKDVPCMVGSMNLFGFRFFRDNNFNVELNTRDNVITLVPNGGSTHWQPSLRS